MYCNNAVLREVWSQEATREKIGVYQEGNKYYAKEGNECTDPMSISGLRALLKEWGFHRTRKIQNPVVRM
mgnify:CR=1 FL=1